MARPAWSTSGSRARQAPSLRGAPPDAGFTLPELMLVLVFVAVLAAVGGPRLFSASAFRADVYRDEVRAALAHAQKRAVASGCEVQIAIDASGYALSQRSGCTGPVFDLDVPHPAGGGGAYAGPAPDGVFLTSTVNPIVFDALGRAHDAGGTIADATVTVGSSQIHAVGETGFVYGSGS